MALYSIELQLPDNETATIQCEDTDTILDAADDNGLDLPYSCRAGACSTCAGVIISGQVDQEDQSFLDDVQIEEQKIILTCVAIPLSDCVVKTHQEELLY